MIIEESEGLLDFVGVKPELEEKLKRRVDVVTYNGINHRLKDLILKEQKVIYKKTSF